MTEIPSDDGRKILVLPVTNKRDPNPPQFSDAIHQPGVCTHSGIYATYTLYPEQGKVLCSCGVQLDPIFVCGELAKIESRWRRHRQDYLDAKAAAEKRMRTKCVHCQKITPIRGLI